MMSNDTNTQNEIYDRLFPGAYFRINIEFGKLTEIVSYHDTITIVQSYKCDCDCGCNDPIVETYEIFPRETNTCITYYDIIQQLIQHGFARDMSLSLEAIEYDVEDNTYRVVQVSDEPDTMLLDEERERIARTDASSVERIQERTRHSVETLLSRSEIKEWLNT